MPRRTFTDLAALDAVLGRCERVVHHADLMAIGMSRSTICWRIGVRGPWQRALPGVVIAHRGIPTRRERLLASLRYAGHGAVITGLPALREYGVPAAAKRPHGPHVLVPHRRQITSHGFVTIERTRRPPEPVVRKRLPLAPVPRALVDACRREAALDDVRELVAEVIQRKLCTPTELAEEVRRAARQRTALSRAVLREIDAGIRSVAEAKVRKALLRRGLPAMEWNVELHTPDGELVGIPDGYWVDLAVALQIDSMAWHLAPKQYRNTQQRRRVLDRHGVLVLAVSPADALDDIDQLVGDLEALRAQGSRRPVPQLVVRRPAA
ncbi:MAG: hypothetical protein M3165_10950 [Actinomycetota bacterium]|nr:hypothetical protein [Actinomycetota bacterium]